MKTNITKLFAGMFCAASLFTTTSCIDETFPTNAATQDQVTASEKASEALLWAMPAFLNDFETVADNHYEWGYGSQMHIRDVMTGDMTGTHHGHSTRARARTVPAHNTSGTTTGSLSRQPTM